jgi:hypothetical protein
LYVKLVSYAEEKIGEYGRVFRRRRSTVDQNFYYEKNFEKMLGTEYKCTSSIDFQAAYDTVWRREIGSEMHKLCPPPKQKCLIVQNFK